jgi:uncharacterized membrane protein YgcG
MSGDTGARAMRELNIQLPQEMAMPTNLNTVFVSLLLFAPPVQSGGGGFGGGGFGGGGFGGGGAGGR